MENTNLTRKQQKIFAGNTTISEEQIAVFGSKTQTGTMAFSKDPDVIQNENWQNGWQNATVLEEAPFEEDFNAISFVNSYNTAYLLQKGIPEYSASTTYFKGSICSIINSTSEPSLYYSLTDNNIGNNPTTDSTNWAKYSDIFSDDYTKIDGSNATFSNLSDIAKQNIIDINYESIQITDSTKVGYIKFYTGENSASITLPDGGTYLVSLTSYSPETPFGYRVGLTRQGLFAGGTVFESGDQGELAVVGFILKIQ